VRGTAVGGPVTVEYEYGGHDGGLYSMRMSMFEEMKNKQAKIQVQLKA